MIVNLSKAAYYDILKAENLRLYLHVAPKFVVPAKQIIHDHGFSRSVYHWDSEVIEIHHTLAGLYQASGTYLRTEKYAQKTLANFCEVWRALADAGFADEADNTLNAYGKTAKMYFAKSVVYALVKSGCYRSQFAYYGERRYGVYRDINGNFRYTKEQFRNMRDEFLEDNHLFGTPDDGYAPCAANVNEHHVYITTISGGRRMF